MAKAFSGKKVVLILQKIYGFHIVHQKGSHLKLRKFAGKEVVTTIVPLHRELATGTLHGLLKLANIEYKEFLRHG